MHDGAQTNRGGLEQELGLAAAMLDLFRQDPASVARVDAVADVIAAAFDGGRKLLACGNGGSACDAMHFCEEFTGRFRETRRPLPAIACTDPGHLSCTANDFGYDAVFERWVEALGREGDVLVAISTSGNSANVVRAVERAQAQGMVTVGLLGRDGGQLRGRCAHEWLVAEPEGAPFSKVHADRIQEIHMIVLHLLVGAVERRLFG